MYRELTAQCIVDVLDFTEDHGSAFFWQNHMTEKSKCDWANRLLRTHSIPYGLVVLKCLIPRNFIWKQDTAPIIFTIKNSNGKLILQEGKFKFIP